MGRSTFLNAFARDSTGICAHQILSRPSNYPTDVIQWTLPTHSWLLEQLNATFKCSISPILPLLIRRVVHASHRGLKLIGCISPCIVVQTMMSPLKWQTRVVSCFQSPQGSGFAVGSIEGRVAFQ